jgi:predicted amidophosphoribosyltransferase
MAPPRPRAEDFTDPYIRTLTPVPPAGPGVCDVCHGAPNTGFPRCYSCAQTIGQVSRPVDLVVPISLYEPASQLHHVLRSYKDGHTAAVRRDFTVRLGALLHRFMRGHGDCIRAAGGDWSIVTSVPSSEDRPGVHPFEGVIELSSELGPSYRRTLSRGPVSIDHNQADDEGFVVIDDVEGEFILLLDDTFTSGARAQSAASALQLAGAEVSAMVPIGRYIRPEWNDEARSLFDDARATGFDFAVCCLE